MYNGPWYCKVCREPMVRKGDIFICPAPTPDGSFFVSDSADKVARVAIEEDPLDEPRIDGSRGTAVERIAVEAERAERP